MSVLVGFFAATSWVADARAAGFAVAEQGAGALGLANAVTGVEDAAGAPFFNPAATTTPGWKLDASVSGILPFLTHEDRETTRSKFGVATPPALSLGWQGGQGIRYGGNLGLNVPFGATLTWPDAWPGRFEVTRISLQVFEFSGNLFVGTQRPGWSGGVALGPRFLRSTVSLERDIDAVDSVGQVALGGTANSVSFQAAGFLKYGDFSAGVNFRPGANLEFSGDADFSEIPIELSVSAHDQPVSTAVDLPMRVAGGLAYSVGAGRVSADVEVFGWSSFESFGIDFSDPNTPDVDEPRNWQDTTAVRLGYEHRGSSFLTWRAGLAFDPTPSPQDTLSPTLPDGDRVVVAAGLGWEFSPRFSGDLGFSHVVILPNEAEGADVFPGTYRGFAEVLSVGSRLDF